MRLTETAVEKETIQTAFALKDSKLEEGEFQGLASVFNHEVDAFIPTIVEPGAFKKTLKERGERVKILWQHDRNEPIGFPLELKETEEGLFVHGKISDTARGRDALALMRDGHQLGKSLELSIGFEPIRWSMEKRKGSKDEEVRRLQEVRLNEISFVTLAADNKAQVTEVNRLGDAEETFAITDEDKSALQTEIKKLNMKDLVATHRRLHQFAARGNLLTGFSRSDMDWFHAQVEAELQRRAKEDGRKPPEPTPLQWGSSKQSAKDKLDLVEVEPTDADMLHLPSRVKKIAEREKAKKKQGKQSEDETKVITLGEFISPVLEEVADLLVEYERAGDADDVDVTSPRLSAFELDEDFAGKVLSDKNRKLLTQVVTILKDLLDAAEPPDDDDDNCDPECKKKKKKGQEKKALEHVNEQWMDAELARARAQLNRLNGG